MSKSTRGRNRHIDIRLKFLQSGITTDMFDFVYIPSADNDSDIGTKVLPLRGRVDLREVSRVHVVEEPRHLGAEQTFE